MNFGFDYITLASSWAFTILAAVALVYSLVLYLWRVDKIRKRRDVKRVYYERWGPTILSLGLVAIVMTNFGFRLRAGGFLAGDGEKPRHGEL